MSTASESGPSVQQLGPQHLSVVTGIHRQALPGGFFARLGSRFLAAYLATYQASPHAVALVALDGDRVCGFLVGSTGAAAHARWVLRQRGARLVLIGVVALALRPRLLVHFARTRLGRYVRGLFRRLRPGGGAPVATAGPGDPAVLAHVAVRPEARGLGLGNLLLQRFIDESRRAGAQTVELVTRTGGGAESFYLRAGFDEVGRRVDADGVPWTSYRLALG